MKASKIAGAIALGLLLAGCATDVVKPTVVQAMAPERLQTIKIKEVVVEAAPGVVMYPPDIERISTTVKRELEYARPGILVPPANPMAASAYTVKISFTRYDGGEAFARYLLMGLGQIRIDGDVDLIDPLGNLEGRYKVSKQFAFGGIYGAVTRIEDVELGFANSVVAIIVPTKARPRR